MGQSQQPVSGSQDIENWLAAAASGESRAYFELGVLYSTGTSGTPVDLVEAHKWFNLASLAGHEESQTCRAEISLEMTAREISEAQREARSWLQATTRRAA